MNKDDIVKIREYLLEKLMNIYTSEFFPKEIDLTDYSGGDVDFYQPEVQAWTKLIYRTYRKPNNFIGLCAALRSQKHIITLVYHLLDLNVAYSKDMLLGNRRLDCICT